jgi:hypothetical protein
VRGAFTLAGSYSRSSNPHGLPSPFGSGEGGKHYRLNRSITMPESHGADVRQSPYVSRLAGIEPEGVTALALAALALLDAINAGRLVATEPGTRALVEALYPLQDALHGPEGQLPQALAGFLSTAGGANHG